MMPLFSWFLSLSTVSDFPDDAVSCGFSSTFCGDVSALSSAELKMANVSKTTPIYYKRI
jgi:hypothetical protein